MDGIFQTLDDFIPIMEADIFKRGVDVAVNHTIKSGNETGFMIYYDIFDESPIYPRKITIGDIVSISNSITMERLNKSSQLNFGKNFDELCPEEELKLYSRIKGTPNQTFLDYPINGEAESDHGLYVHSLFSLDYSVPLITFHTHPKRDEDSLRFSSQDLRALNYRTRESYIKHISIVVGTEFKSENIPFLMIQEKDVLNSSFPFDETRIDFRGPSYKLLSSLAKRDYDPLNNLAKENYNVAQGVYNSKIGFKFIK